MSALQELEQRIHEKFAVAHQQKPAVQRETQQRSAEIEHARRQFGEIADRLLSEIICPRVEKLATHFNNVELHKPDEVDHRYSCVCHFRASPHFTANARLELSITHDEQVEYLLVLYRLEIGPNYIPFKGEVQLVFPIDKVDEDQLIRWLDDQIVDFVDAYLSFEYSGVGQHLVVDPVCGMVLNRHRVAGETNYQGKTYYFCVENCRGKFVEAPERYLSVP
jgi:YHS domain-containing protein